MHFQTFFSFAPGLADQLLYTLGKFMKSLMILGSVAGFLIGAGCSLASGCPWSVVVWRALAAALAAGVMARWWAGAWRQGWQGAIEQRRHEPPAPRPNPKPSAKL